MKELIASRACAAGGLFLFLAQKKYPKEKGLTEILRPVRGGKNPIHEKKLHSLGAGLFTTHQLQWAYEHPHTSA